MPGLQLTYNRHNLRITNAIQFQSVTLCPRPFRPFSAVVRNFSWFADPCNRKLRKNQPRTYTDLSDKELEALEFLRRKLVSPPLLLLPELQSTYAVDKDVRDRQIGCIFPQKKPVGPNKTIRYWSRSGMDAERPYDSTGRECLAFVCDMLLPCPYLEGT